MSTITTKDGTTIYYKDWGKGPVVTLSHGWPLNSDMWDGQMLFLAQHGFRVVAHDRRGHGRSSHACRTASPPRTPTSSTATCSRSASKASGRSREIANHIRLVRQEHAQIWRPAQVNALSERLSAHRAVAPRRARRSLRRSA